MKTRKNIFILILILTIGFAAVATTLRINGGATLGFNETNFDVYFSEAILDGADKTNVIINNTKDVIEFNTKDLSSIGDYSILNFEITNNSSQYNANVEISCEANDDNIFQYIDVETSLDKPFMEAKTLANGYVKFTMIKTYPGGIDDKLIKCKIVASPGERTAPDFTEIFAKKYYSYGYLLNKQDDPISDAVIVTYSEEPKYVVTDRRGMYLTTNLEGGDHEMFVIVGYSLDEVKAFSKDQLRELSKVESFNTRDREVTSEDYRIRMTGIGEEDPVLKEVTFDTQGALDASFTAQVILGKPIGYLPRNINHSTLILDSWLLNGEKVLESTIVTDEMTTLQATYGDGPIRINGKYFRVLNAAIDYASDNDTIEVLADLSVGVNVHNNKTATLELNRNTINFNEFEFVNEGNLTIKSGIVTGDGFSLIENNSSLNLTDVDINHHNGNVEDIGVTTILNNGVLNVTDGSMISVANKDLVGFGAIVSNGETNINNSTFRVDGSSILINAGGSFTLNNNSVITHTRNSTTRLFENYGVLTLNDSTLDTEENDVGSKGLITTYANAVTNINSGIIDGTRSISSAIYAGSDSTTNIGESGKEVELRGSNGNTYIASVGGALNIKDGTINCKTGYGFGVFGVLTIGSDTAVPTLNGATGKTLIEIRSNNPDSKIVNANINTSEAYALNVYKENRLVIDNVNLSVNNTSSTKRSIYVTGLLTINNGTFNVDAANKTSQGLIDVNGNGTLNINSGIFNGAAGTADMIYVYEGGTFNLGQVGKEVVIVAKKDGFNGSYAVKSRGTFNVIAGTIKASNGHLFESRDNGVMTVGTDTTIPTFDGPDGYRAIQIRSNTENRIKNAYIISKNALAINTMSNSNLIIDNMTLVHERNGSTSRAIEFCGSGTINGGTFKVAEANASYEKKAGGLINIKNTATVTINGGTFDNTYGSSSLISQDAGSTLNLGATGGEINIIGNKSGSYTITANGNLNITGGTINFQNGFAFGCYGLLTVGSETSKPIINGATGYKVFAIRSANANSKIVNAEINAYNGTAIDVYPGKQLTIDNVVINTYSKSGRLLNVSGTLNVNGGTFTSYATGNNAIYVAKDGLLNIGQNKKNLIEIKNDPSSENTYPFLFSYGNVNIYDGHIDANTARAIWVTMNTNTTPAPTTEDKKAYPYKVKIYGGLIETNSSTTSTITVDAGTLEMYGGKVVNHSTGYTINNTTGNAIQTGGESANNNNVTVQ